MDNEINTVSMVILSLLVTAGIVYTVSVFNSLIQVKNNIGKAWHNIDVLLVQRNEELPKLIDVTRAYVQYERGILETLAKLRTQYISVRRIDQKIRIENELEGRVLALKGVWEGTPSLKADQVFRRLQERVSELESLIADRRAFFNETVKIYNIQCEQFPQLIIAPMLGFRHHPYLYIPMT